MAEAFLMSGAREVLSRLKGAGHMQQQIELIETSVVAYPNNVFDIAKALVETCCKTILTDRSVVYDGSSDLPALFRHLLENIRLVPEDHSGDTELQGKVRKLVGATQTMVSALCEVRNHAGMSSHGQDAFALSLLPAQAMFAARTADALVTYLFTMHLDHTGPRDDSRRRHSDKPVFNEYVDELHEKVKIFGYTYAASEVLFAVDMSAYDAELEAYDADAETRTEKEGDE
ncbi:MAG: abortive infection family protein [Flavobacteriales bacterium]|nr:abortive infection family protein [Flavobacteriales bacterium]